MTDYMERE